MYRGIRDDRPSAKHNTPTLVVTATIEGDKQKQKKRLSFKEPEIEPRQNFVHRPLSSTSKHSSLAKEKNFYQERAESLEDLTLEDQALQIVKNVGQAFIRPTSELATAEKSSTLTKTKTAPEEGKQKELAIEDTLFRSTNHSTRTDEPTSRKPAASITPSAMRCPIIEIAAEDDDKTAGEDGERSGGAKDVGCLSSSAPKNAGIDSGWPTSARHQIQLLNLQLEQQRQQTQTAMSQIQLLKDQLEAESSARYQAQIQNQQLMNQNKELVNQIQQLFQQIQDLEKQVENHKKSSQQSTPEIKQGTLAPPGQPCGYRRNSSSLWSNTLSLIGRRNSATLSPTPQSGESSDSCQKQFFADSFGRRTSITEDLAAVSSLSRFGGATDWRLRRRGSSNLCLDFSSKGKSSSSSNNNNGFNAIEDTTPPIVDRTKIAPLFSPESRLRTVSPTKSRTETNRSVAVNPYKADSLVIDESATVPSSTLWSGSSFKPIDPDGQTLPSYAKRQIGKQTATDKQSQLARSLETLRLFNS